MKIVEYNRQKVIEYAKTWAYNRNPKYYNYDYLGGDCTNFASQCVFAGSKIMNYSKSNGWYYINTNDKSPSWTGVEFFFNFLISNKSVGPYGKAIKKEEIEIGDIVQLSFDNKTWGHTLVVVSIENKFSLSGIKIASHTFDSYNKPITDYLYKNIRFIHIENVRKWA